jgi:ABC-type protease/lipase transport system fused ATPase/permease subunit
MSRRHTPAFIAAYTLVINALALTGPAYLLLLYDRILPAGSVGELLAATGGMLASYALGTACDISRQRLMQGGPLGQLAPALCDVPLTPIYLSILLLLHPLLGALALMAIAAVVSCAALIARGDALAPARMLLLAGILRGLRPAMQSAMLGLGVYLVMAGACCPGRVFAATIVLPRLIAPVETIAMHWRLLRGALRDARLAAATPGVAPAIDLAAAQNPRGDAARPSITIILRRSGDYARKATRGGTRSMSSDLRPTAQ